jgi:hypothetical protein
MTYITKAPSKAIISPIDATANSSRPTIEGTADAGTTISLYDGVRLLGTTVVTENGTWVFTSPIDLKPGRHLFTAISTNDEQLNGCSSDQMLVVLPASPPPVLVAPPSIESMTDFGADRKPVDGNLPSGSTIAYSLIRLYGSGVEGDIVKLYEGTNLVGSTRVKTGGMWTLDISTLTDDTHHLSATQTNADGVESARSNVWDVTIDTKPHLPEAPTVLVLGEYDAVHVNIGAVATGETTAYHRLQLEGFSAPGALIKMYDGETLLASTVAKPDGTWFFYSEDWQNGQHDLSVTQTASDSVESARSGKVTFTVASNEPEAPSVDYIGTGTADHGVADGVVASGGVSAYPYLFIKGRGEPNAQVTIYDGSTLIGKAIANSVGHWRLWAPVLADGQHDISATITGTAGQMSPHSNDYVVNIDTSNYAAPIILSMRDSTRTILSGEATHDTNVVVYGTGKIGDLITLYEGNTAYGSATVDSTRHWSIQSPANLTNGSHDLVAKSAMAAGTPDDHSSFFSFVVNTGSLAAPEITGITSYDAAGRSMGGLHQTGDSIACMGFKVAGSGEMGSIITMSDGAQVIGSTKVTESGTWGLSVSPVIAGFHDLSVVQVNSMLEVSPRSEHWTFTISTAYTATLGFDEPVDPVLLAGTGETANVDVTSPPVSAEPAVPHTPIISGKTRAVAPIAENQQSDTSADAVHVEPPVTVGEHETAGLTASGHAVVLSGDPATYFNASTAHIQGSASGADTLNLAGDHQLIDLTSLTGKTAAAKISGIEVIDLGGQHNTLKLSLVDVLNLGEHDMFRNDGKQQMLVRGMEGDSVDLSNAHVAGIADGEWQLHETAQVGGITYGVYEHSSAPTELLVQQGVQVTLHA